MFHRGNLSMSSAGVGEVSTIFHPRRSRAPSIVLSEDQQTRGTFSNPVQVVLDNSACEQQQGCSVGGCGDSTSSCRSLETSGSNVGAGSATTGGQGHGQTQAQANVTSATGSCLQRQNTVTACYTSCCAESAKKIYFGVCVTIFVTASWVGATHCIKYLYFHKPKSPTYSTPGNSSANSTELGPHHRQTILQYDAPFFTTWFCTNWVVLYFPVYFLCRATATKCSNPSEIIAESLRGFRDKGFTVARFLVRCGLFCGLWVLTNYMYIHSLRILLATDVMALFATNVCCVYLLSWVILHEQFVGVRIVAVILCDTGIALLAYMDGITGSPTLGGVVLAAAAAAGSAVYKVLFKRVIGETTFGQVSLFFSLIGLCNAALLWPVCLILYVSGAETVQWARLPWATLLSASVLHLVANMLGNFSIALTYDLFITLGLITAVPVSAALDVVLYGAHFMGMKLAGIILIAVGFFLVMFPDNWPDYITRLLRNIILVSESASTNPAGTQYQHHQRRARVQRVAMPPRQYRLRNYGVTTAHGDGQSLLPSTNGNNNSGNGHRHLHQQQQQQQLRSQRQTSGTGQGQSNSSGNLVLHRFANATSQQNVSPSQSSRSDTQNRRFPTSTSTSTSSTATVIANNRRSHSPATQIQQDGAGDTDTSQAVRPVTSSTIAPDT